MEIYGSRYVKVRLTTATEFHNGGPEEEPGRLTKVRVQIFMSNFCRVLFIASILFAGLLLIDLWPFSRPAVLLPLTGWAMYLVNKWRVSAPVLGLIDQAAETAAFYPVHEKPAGDARV